MHTYRASRARCRRETDVVYVVYIHRFLRTGEARRSPPSWNVRSVPHLAPCAHTCAHLAPRILARTHAFARAPSSAAASRSYGLALPFICRFPEQSAAVAPFFCFLSVIAHTRTTIGHRWEISRTDSQERREVTEVFALFADSVHLASRRNPKLGPKLTSKTTDKTRVKEQCSGGNIAEKIATKFLRC